MTFLSKKKFCSLSLIYYCLTAMSLDALADVINGEAKTISPFRMGVLSLGAYLDNEKPLGMIDNPGFVTTNDLLIGSFDEKWIGAYSLNNRKIVWWIEAPASLTSPPTIISSWIIMGFRDGSIYKAEVDTGKIVWKVNVDSYARTAFVLSGTSLIFVSAAQVVYAIDFSSGKTNWLYDGGFPEKLPINSHPRPLLWGDTVIVGLSSGEIHGINQTSGKMLWKFNPEISSARFQDVVGELVIPETNILLLSRYDGIVAAVNLSHVDKNIIWKDSIPGITTSTFGNGQFYVGTLGGDVYVYSVSAGKKIWRSITGQSIANIFVNDKTVIAAGTKGRISSLDPRTGSLIWSDDIGGLIVNPPVSFKGGIFYETGLKNFYGYKY